MKEFKYVIVYLNVINLNSLIKTKKCFCSSHLTKFCFVFLFDFTEDHKGLLCNFLAEENVADFVLMLNSTRDENNVRNLMFHLILHMKLVIRLE